jgi:STE24 endopeptidase
MVRRVGLVGMTTWIVVGCLVASLAPVRAWIDDAPWVVALPLVVIVMRLGMAVPGVAAGAYERLRIERELGLSSQPARDWWRDIRRELGAELVVRLASSLLLWGVVRVAPGRWVAAAALLSALAALTYATWPLRVGHVVPLTTPPVEIQVLADRIADATGTRRTPVLIADMRSRRAAPNGMVCGLGPLRRIVLFDSVLACEPAHIEALVAHEVGHLRHHDLAGRLVIAAGANSVLVAVLFGLGSSDVVGLFREAAWSAAAYPMFVAVATLIEVYAGLIMAGVSRDQERDADTFALHATDRPAAFREMISVISLANLSPLEGPGGVANLGCPVPPAVDRIAAAARYEEERRERERRRLARDASVDDAADAPPPSHP